MNKTTGTNTTHNYNDGLPVGGEMPTIANGKVSRDWDCTQHARACITCCSEQLVATDEYDQFDRQLTLCPEGHKNIGMPTNAYFEAR